LVKPDGSQNRLLPDDREFSYSDLSWTPDGRYLVFQRCTYTSSGNSETWLPDSQTGKETRVQEHSRQPGLLL